MWAISFSNKLHIVLIMIFSVTLHVFACGIVEHKTEVGKEISV